MDLTHSYKTAFDETIQGRYQFLEVRNAAAVLLASNPECFDDLVTVLDGFVLTDGDILIPGGNRGTVPIKLDSHFADLGWVAVRINTEYKLMGKAKTDYTARSYEKKFIESAVSNSGFEVDNFKGRVAIDVEWNAKDGNLDRDLSAYRALYDVGLIDVAVIITRDHQGIRSLAQNDLKSDDAYRRLGTSTTTNLEKLIGRLTRGDGGGCPILAVGITRATWEGANSA